jgi:EmrB/QacA subfamily drug resistance transporter
VDKRQKLVLVIAILASFVPFLDGSIVNVALPAMSSEVGGGLVTEQWVLDGYLLSLSALILVAGSFSDLFGRSRVLAAGLLLFGLASVLCALAPTSGFLIAARVLQGVGGALLVPSSLAIITANFDGALRARAIGVWTGWTGVAFIAGPVFGGTLVEFFGWRWIFGINVVPIALTLLLLARLGDRATPPATTPRIDVVGALLGSVGLAAPVFALIEHQRLGWDHPAVLVALIGGVIVFAAFLVWERRTAAPMLPLALFSVRNFAVGNMATAFVYASISLTPLAVTLFLQRVVGATPLQAGLASLPQAIIPLLLSGTFGTLAGRYGPRWFMAAGPAVAGLGALWLLLTREPFDFWTQMLPGLLLLGLGLTMTVAPLTAAVLGAVSSSQSGIASAANNAVSRVAGLIAVAFLGALVGGTLDFDGFHRVAVTGTVLLFIAAAVSAVGISNSARPVKVQTD